MVENRWYVILEAHELPRSGPLGVTRLGHPLAIWRDAAGTLHAT